MVFLSVAGFVISSVWSSREGYGIAMKSLFNTWAKVLHAKAKTSVFVLYLKGFYVLALAPLVALLCFIILLIMRGIDKEDLSLVRPVFLRQKEAIDEGEHDTG